MGVGDGEFSAWLLEGALGAEVDSPVSSFRLVKLLLVSVVFVVQSGFLPFPFAIAVAFSYARLSRGSVGSVVSGLLLSFS